MKNIEFENLLLLLENESTFELGMDLAQNYQSEFESHFECTIDEYKELIEFLKNAYDYQWSFGDSFLDVVSLTLNRDKVKIIPTQIKKLKKLEYIWLNGNQITHIPREIGELKNLRQIILTNNNIQTFDLELSNLKYNLVYFHLSGNIFSEKERIELKKLLPNTHIYF